MARTATVCPLRATKSSSVVACAASQHQRAHFVGVCLTNEPSDGDNLVCHGRGALTFR